MTAPIDYAELARVRVLLDEAVENEDRILDEMKMRRDEFAEYRIQASTEIARVQAMLDEALAAKPVRCGYCDGTGRDKTGQSCGGCAGTGTPAIFRRKDTP